MREAVTFALAEKIGKSSAHHLVEAASKKAAAERLHLHSVLASDPKVTAQLDPDRIEELFAPGSYQGVSQALIDRLLASLEGRGVT
jgi:3-carboxy-cis,cis-muconate cycloisomerase